MHHSTEWAYGYYHQWKNLVHNRVGMKTYDEHRCFVPLLKRVVDGIGMSFRENSELIFKAQFFSSGSVTSPGLPPHNQNWQGSTIFYSYLIFVRKFDRFELFAHLFLLHFPIFQCSFLCQTN